MKNKLKNFSLCYICLISFSINAERFGDPGEIIPLKASGDDIDKYLTVKINESLYKLIPLPFEKQNESISKNRFEYDINVWDSDVQKGTLIKKLTTPIETPTILIKPESSLVRESQIEKLKNNYLSFKINEIPRTSHMVIFESSLEVSKLISKHIK